MMVFTHAVGVADGIRYDWARAEDAWRAIGHDKLKQLLCAAGNVCTLHYPGIGVAPPRPGGDIKFATRADFLGVLDMFLEANEAFGDGQQLFLTGAKGIGKSCYLRALAWLLMLAGHRVVCLWNMKAALDDLLREVISALRFAYCCEDGNVRAEINAIRSVEGVWTFMKGRTEKFILIIDGAEVLDTVTAKGEPRSDKETREAVRLSLQKLITEAHVTVGALSPMASNCRKRKAKDENWVKVNQGFYGEELGAYLTKVSVLGKLIEQKDDIIYFCASHPMSLSALDASCRRRARTRPKLGEDGPAAEWTDGEVAELLKDKGEWDETMKLFLSSAEMTTIYYTGVVYHAVYGQGAKQRHSLKLQLKGPFFHMAGSGENEQQKEKCINASQAQMLFEVG